MYAFVHIDKTAGSTMTAILRRCFGTRHCDIRLPLIKRNDDGIDHRAIVDATDLRRVQRIYRNLRGISGHNVKAYSDLHTACPNIAFFTVLRDPASRFRSHFKNRAECHSMEGFYRWTENDVFHNWQTKMIAGEPSAQKAIDLLSTRFQFVAFTERFDEGLVLLGLWLREPDYRPEYRRVNQLSEKRRPRDIARGKCDLSYLDSDAVRSRIQDVNSEDQRVYDFVKNVVYPKQLAAFPGDLSAEVRDLERRNQALMTWNESARSRLVRNYVYKPLLHCRAI
ncbi:MAG: sulfotransferase family 2 domain-containing protein [Planctomycetes bacterium]|nr:sulfotransferase family 2 domain-containing protein [Planctomycetota bacterium]